MRGWCASRHEVTFSAFASQISSKNGKTKGTRHSPDMATLRYLMNRAEHVTSWPMMCTMVHIMLAHARGRVAMSPVTVLSKVGIKIGQYDDGGSNGDDNMSIVAIYSAVGMFIVKFVNEDRKRCLNLHEDDCDVDDIWVEIKRAQY